MYGNRPSLHDRPSSRAGTPGGGGRPARRPATPMEQVAQLEDTHLQQVRKEVEHAATRVYEEEVRDYRQLVLGDRKQRTAELEASHRVDVVERNRQALAHRVDRTRLHEDEVYLDRRLHEAMETKLGRLTYLREHARVQRVLATTRSLIRRKDAEKRRQATLQELVASCGAKDATHLRMSRGSASASPHRNRGGKEDEVTKDLRDSGTSSLPTSSTVGARAGTPSPAKGQQRQSDIGARQRTVDRLVDREAKQHGFAPKLGHGGLYHHQRNGGVHGMHSSPVDIASRVATPSSTTGAGHQCHDGRPLSRTASLPGDDVDWGGGNPAQHHAPVQAARPASRQSQGSSAGSYRPQAHSRLSSAASSIPRGGSGHNNKPHVLHGQHTSTATTPSAQARYMEHNARPRLLLPPLPALIEPSGLQQHTMSATHPPLPRPSSVISRSGSGSATPIVDPFPEDNANAYYVMEAYREQHTTLRRPNSRGLEDQRLFEKHSMRFLGDLILGRTTPSHSRGSKRVDSPQQQPPSRRGSPIHRPPSTDLVEEGSRNQDERTLREGNNRVRHLLPRTVRAASSSIEASVAGICPPMSNTRGELDAFETHQTRRMQDEAVTWCHLFGKHRAAFQPRRGAPQNEEDYEEEEVMEEEVEEDEAAMEVASEGLMGYEMGDMSLPREFHDASHGGGQWIGRGEKQGYAEDDQRQHRYEPHGEPEVENSGRVAAAEARQTPQDTVGHRREDRQEAPPVEETATAPRQEQKERSPAPLRTAYEPPCTPQQFEALRQQLHAHHGGAGGDVPSHRGRGHANATVNANHPADRDCMRHSSTGEEPQPPASRIPAKASSILPRVEPDFSFENFFVGSFEAQEIQPHASAATMVDRGDGANDEDELFPAPPADASRFEDFGSSSSSDDDDDDDDEYAVDDDDDSADADADADADAGAGARAQAQAEDVPYADDDMGTMATQNGATPSPQGTADPNDTVTAAEGDDDGETVSDDDGYSDDIDVVDVEAEDGGALSGEAMCAPSAPATANIDDDRPMPPPATGDSASETSPHVSPADADVAAATVVAHAFVESLLDVLLSRSA